VTLLEDVCKTWPISNEYFKKICYVLQKFEFSLIQEHNYEVLSVKMKNEQAHQKLVNGTIKPLWYLKQLQMGQKQKKEKN